MNRENMHNITSICVNAGSSPGLLAEYGQVARELGKCLAAHGITIVFGGADVGLMGDMANSALANGGKVIGVIPEAIVEKIGHDSLTELHVVPSMHERKKLMFELSDGFIALPGGMGTLDEIFEVLTWAQLGFHSKPCGLLNVCGYFDDLLRFLEHSVNQQFVKREHRDMLLVGECGDELLEKFRRYQRPATEKWFSVKRNS